MNIIKKVVENQKRSKKRYKMSKKYLQILLFVIFGIYISYIQNDKFTVFGVVTSIIISIGVYFIFIWGYQKTKKK